MRSLPSLGRAFGITGFIHPDQRVFSLQISVCREVVIRNWGGGRNLTVSVLSLFCLGAQSGVKCVNNIQVSTLGRLMRAVNN